MRVKVLLSSLTRIGEMCSSLVGTLPAHQLSRLFDQTQPPLRCATGVQEQLVSREVRSICEYFLCLPRSSFLFPTFPPPNAPPRQPPRHHSATLRHSQRCNRRSPPWEILCPQIPLPQEM